MCATRIRESRSLRAFGFAMATYSAWAGSGACPSCWFSSTSAAECSVADHVSAVFPGCSGGLVAVLTLNR